jgi:glycosyltransferase involved in cell wall biosynthesis
VSSGAFENGDLVCSNSPLYVEGSARSALSIDLAPQVSVLMPTFNQAIFIERAIRSVFTQAGVSVELLVMDGGSTDGTPELLERLAAEFGSALRWASTPDRGPAHALNKALAKARGHVIGWLNSDDLYLPGALQRALAYLAENPHQWMVYGQGEHIDALDRHLGHYPSRSPDCGLQGFADGCYICQPTVFIRRMALRGLGGFDESLRTAFDLALWLRLFSRHPERVGYLDVLQARSRLHAGCITQTQRAQVIREGMTLLARYLGAAPLHWLRSFADEAIAAHPFGPIDGNLRDYVEGFAASVAHLLSAGDLEAMHQWLATDARLRLALPDACLQLEADGWLLAESELRIRPGAWRMVTLTGRHMSPLSGALTLQLQWPDGSLASYKLLEAGPFSLKLALPIAAVGAQWRLPIHVKGGFVPSEHHAGSGDNRHLACLIDGLQLDE